VIYHATEMMLIESFSRGWLQTGDLAAIYIHTHMFLILGEVL